MTHEIYEKLVRYAEYPDLSLGQCSNVSSTGATVIQFFNISSTDTQAAFWKLPSEKQILVSIPGTNSTEDYITDFDFFFTGYDSPGVKCPEGCLVHNGFLGAWNSLAAELIPALENVLEANPDYNTIITGHSLGGALAQLAFASLITDPKYRVLEAYTYGQPRVGNGIFADYIDALAGASEDDIGIFHRVTHYNGTLILKFYAILDTNISFSLQMVSLYYHPESLVFRIRSQSFGSQLIRAKSQQHIDAMATSLQNAMILLVDSG